MWVKVNLLCVQTRVMYREQIPVTSFEMRKKTASDLWIFEEIWCVLTIWVYRTAGGCSQLSETKIKHPIYRLFRQNHSKIIFEDENWNEKGICLEMLQNVEIGGIVLSRDVVFAKIVLVDFFTACAVTENMFPTIPRHEYIFIFKFSACSLQQCFINY